MPPTSSPPEDRPATGAAGGTPRIHPTTGRPRIGLLGGTFDPPHVGHVAIAEACRDELGLDRLLLVVANDPWQKAPVRRITPAEDRYAMVAAAAESLRAIEASRIEIDRGGPSYTVDTVEQLAADARRLHQPAPQLFVVVGADLVPTLDTWHRYTELQRQVTLVVVPRPHAPPPACPEGWHFVVLAGPRLDVSSSEVRALLEAGKPVDGLVPGPVVRCIRRRRLYAVGR